MSTEQHWLVSALMDPNVTVTSRSLFSLRRQCLDVAASAAVSLDLWERDEDTKFAGWYPQAFMRGSVAFVMSAFAMEAAINEAATILEIDADARRELEAESNPLNRADVLAMKCGFPKISQGTKTGQHAALLYKIRNAFAHGKSEWSNEEKTHAALSNKILSLKLPLSRFMLPQERAFPIGCMSGRMANWAVDTAENYITEYYSAAGIS